MSIVTLSVGSIRSLAVIAANLPHDLEDSAVVKLAVQKKGIAVYDRNQTRITYLSRPFKTKTKA